MIHTNFDRTRAGAGESRTVADVRIGLRYTAVLLDNGSCGLAYTFQGAPPAAAI
jgi:hypothetical protein